MNTTRKAFEPYVTISDVAKAFRLSKRTIHRYMKGGIIPYHRITDRITRFRLSEVESALIARR